VNNTSGQHDIRRPLHIRAKRSPLTPDELRRVLEHFGVPPHRLARHLGCRDQTVRNWLNGRNPIPGHIHALLMLYDVKPYTRGLRGPVPVPVKQWLKAPPPA
jgi:DNA-binding transcriptional regulator YiaG